MALVLGAPGVYRASEEADHAYRGVRLDVAGFVGIAPRGPGRVGPMGEKGPVARAVESWSAYQELYGGFEGPGRLPYAVAAFFEQGGRKAWVVRVVPWDDDSTGATATARHRFGSLTAGIDRPVELAAGSEGAWGNGLRMTLELAVSREFLAEGDDAGRPVGLRRSGGQPPGAPGTELVLPDGVEVPVGSVLRVRCRDRLDAMGVLTTVRSVAVVDRPLPQPVARVLILDPPLPVTGAPGGDGPVLFEVGVVTGTLTVDHADPQFRPRERFEQLGLRPEHPRWLWSVLEETSSLVLPVGEWADEPLLLTDPLLAPLTTVRTVDGADVDERIDVDRDLFDPSWDPLVEDRSWRGVHALAEVDEIGLLVVPDLFWSRAPEPEEPAPAPELPCRPVFLPCRPEPVAVVPPPPVGDLLDGSTVASFQRLVGRQQRLVELAEGQRRFVVLLDVPQRMPVARIEQWRASFDSSYAAGYHPWLRSDRLDDGRNQLIDVPPSAAAAGIISARENRLGIAWGPANEVVQGVVSLAVPITGELHDRLHLQGVNVFRQEPVGVRLSAARTLSRDPAWRQLSVRRLLLKIRLTLLRESQWMVFEPNNERLRAEVSWYLTLFLRQLYLGGAFTGATEAEAFFVHCDDRLNPPSAATTGQLLVEIGVAPAEPLEYLVLRIARQRDGSFEVEEGRG